MALGYFFFCVVVYIAYKIPHENIIAIALAITAVCTAIPLCFFLKYKKTPVELLKEGNTEECKAELRKMYWQEEGATRRYEELSRIMQQTDRYKICFFKLFLLPANYRKPLLIGVLIGISQGIINAFFEGFLCELVGPDYCQEEMYSLGRKYFYYIFSYALTPIPAACFIRYFERIFQLYIRLWKDQIVYPRDGTQPYSGSSTFGNRHDR